MNKLFLILLMLTPFTLKAQEVEAILLTTKENDKIGFVLDETLSLRFSNETLIIKNADKEVSYPMTNIANICYLSEDEIQSASVNNLYKENDIILFRLSDYVLTIDNALGESVEILDTNGKIVKISNVIESEYRVDFSQYPAGTYIVHCKNQTIKIFIK